MITCKQPLNEKVVDCYGWLFKVVLRCKFRVLETVLNRQAEPVMNRKSRHCGST